MKGRKEDNKNNNGEERMKRRGRRGRREGKAPRCQGKDVEGQKNVREGGGERGEGRGGSPTIS